MTMSEHLKKLAAILSDGDYHSGTEIGAELGLTRSGVWKLMQQLSTLGLQIESVTNKGYRLANQLEFLDKNLIKRHLSTANYSLIKKIFIFDDIPSTNDYLSTYAKSHKGEQAVCLAEQQSAGRGRMGRRWVSPFAANIYLSLLWHFACDISELSGLNILVGVSVAEALQEITGDADIQLKWPNDLFWNQAKLGGILIDLHGEFSGGCSVVIGIGVNVNMSAFNIEKINKPWIDLRQVAGSEISRNQVAGMVLDRLITNLLTFHESGMTKFIKKWEKLDYLAGKKTTIKVGEKPITGMAKGINQNGHLLIKLEDNSLITITTGDASVLSASSK